LLTCLSTAGDIHIWDRESGTLLHHVHAQSLGDGDLTCVAWNPTAEPFMFATGSHDGAVRIWNAVPVSTPSRDRRGRSGSVTPLSQLHLDLGPRNEYSAGQQRFGQLLGVEISHVESSEDAAGPSSRRAIAFPNPQVLGISYRPPTPV
jgi:WD repeat-containing protein 26